MSIRVFHVIMSDAAIDNKVIFFALCHMKRSEQIFPIQNLLPVLYNILFLLVYLELDTVYADALKLRDQTGTFDKPFISKRRRA